MAKQESLNPRSFSSIRQAIRERRYRGRGELMRAVADAFRAPQIAARETPKAVEAPKRKRRAVE